MVNRRVQGMHMEEKRFRAPQMTTTPQTTPDNKATMDQFVSELINDIKSGALKLPMLPQVALKVRQVVDDHDSNSEDVARIIATDPALSTRLLQVTNSPLYRGSLTIENIPMAVTRLGRNNIRTIVLSLMLKRLYQVENRSLGAQLGRVWRHSIEVAAIARVLATTYTALDAEEAMLAGLVHDIGMLPVIAKAEQYPEVATDRALLEAACHRLHQAIGKLVLQTWKLPPALVVVAGQHENWRYDDSVQAEYIDIVIIANLHARRGTYHPLSQVNWSEVPAFQKVGLDAEESLNVVQAASEELSHIKSFFN